MCNENYEYYKSHHVCVRCRHEDAEKNHTLCLNCMMKDREASINYYHEHKEEIKEKKRITDKIRYNRLKSLGICTSCGKRTTKNNKVVCEHCSARINNRNRAKYLLNVYATRTMAEIRI